MQQQDTTAPQRHKLAQRLIGRLCLHGSVTAHNYAAAAALAGFDAETQTRILHDLVGEGLAMVSGQDGDTPRIVSGHKLSRMPQAERADAILAYTIGSKVAA